MQPNPSYRRQAQPCSGSSDSSAPTFDNGERNIMRLRRILSCSVAFAFNCLQFPPIHPQAPSIGYRFTRRNGARSRCAAPEPDRLSRFHSFAASPRGTVHRPVGPAHLPTLSGCKHSGSLGTAQGRVQSAIAFYGAHYYVNDYSVLCM